MNINDGAYGTNDSAGVREGRVDVNSRTSTRQYYVSRDRANAFSFTTSYNCTGSPAQPFYLKNKNTDYDHMTVTTVKFSSAKEGFFEIYGASGNPTGTTISGANLNTMSNRTASVTCLGGGVSQLTLSGRFAMARTQAYGLQTILPAGALIGQEIAIAVQYTGGNGTVDVEVAGYWENK